MFVCVFDWCKPTKTVNLTHSGSNRMCNKILKDRKESVKRPTISQANLCTKRTNGLRGKTGAVTTRSACDTYQLNVHLESSERGDLMVTLHHAVEPIRHPKTHFNIVKLGVTESYVTLKRAHNVCIRQNKKCI